MSSIVRRYAPVVDPSEPAAVVLEVSEWIAIAALYEEKARNEQFASVARHYENVRRRILATPKVMFYWLQLQRVSR